MKKTKSWEVSDAFWEQVEPLIPEYKRNKNNTYKRKLGGGRKRLEPRRAFAGIVYVLRTGCQWNALPKEYGSSSAVHRYFQEWIAQGVFEALWKKGLQTYNELEGIAWEWQSADGTMNKSPMGAESVGKNPTDRGKKWGQAKYSRRRERLTFINYDFRS